MSTKRVIDVALSAIGLLVLCPVMLVVAILIRARLGPPILFRQTRAGRGALPFEMVKFRTMSEIVGRDGQVLADSERLTPLGSLLRSSSIDELPELWNVISGEMSLVGPRPLLMEYLPLYDSEQARRHEVRPGITGWAQVNGRNALSWEEKFKLDVWYVDHCNLWLDLKILCLTVKKVIVKEGVSADGEATMPKFTGTN